MMQHPPVVVFEPLARSHDLSAFTCGNAEMDGWLQHEAMTGQWRRDTSTHVALLENPRRVIGYLTMCEALISSPPLIPVPGVLLARLAVSSAMQGQRLGTLMLFQAMLLAVEMGRPMQWQYLMLDAIDDHVAAFYTKFGFHALGSDPLRLYMSASAVETIVSRAFPPRSGAPTVRPGGGMRG